MSDRFNTKSRRVRFAVQNNGSSAVSDVWVFSTRTAPSAPKQYHILKNQPSRKNLLKMILGELGGCFQKKGYCFYLQDPENGVIVKSFSNLDQILRFMLQHGIPQANHLSDDLRDELTRGIVFCRVPHHDFVNAQLGRSGFRASDARIIFSDDKIISLLHKVGFVFQDSKGNKLLKASKANEFKFARILPPGFSRRAGGSMMSSFTTLEEVRVFVRQERLSSNKALSHHLEQRLQMLALRIWGATALVPLPKFDWNRFRAHPDWKPTPMELLQAARSPNMSATAPPPPRPILKQHHSLPYLGGSTTNSSSSSGSSVPSASSLMSSSSSFVARGPLDDHNHHHVRTALSDIFRQQQQQQQEVSREKDASENVSNRNNQASKNQQQHFENQSSVNDENREN